MSRIPSAERKKSKLKTMDSEESSDDDEKSKAEAEKRSFSKTHTTRVKKGKEKLKAKTDLIFKRTHERIRQREFLRKCRQMNLSISKTAEVNYGNLFERKESNNLNQSVWNYSSIYKKDCPISRERNEGRLHLSKVSEESRRDPDRKRIRNHDPNHQEDRCTEGSNLQKSISTQNFEVNTHKRKIRPDNCQREDTQDNSSSNLQKSTSTQNFEEIYSGVNTRKRKIRADNCQREDTHDNSSSEDNLKAVSVVEASAEISPTLKKAKPNIVSNEQCDASQTKKILEGVRKSREQMRILVAI